MGKSWSNKNTARSVQFGRKLYPSYRHNASARTRIFSGSLTNNPAYREVPWIGNDPVVEMTFSGARVDRPIYISSKYAEAVQANIFRTNEVYTFPDGSFRTRVRKHLWLGGTFVIEPEVEGMYYFSDNYYEAVLEGKKLITACYVFSDDFQDQGKLLVSVYEVHGRDGEKTIELKDQKQIVVPYLPANTQANVGNDTPILANPLHYRVLTKYGFTQSWSNVDLSGASPETWTYPAQRKVGWVEVSGFTIAATMTQRVVEDWTEVGVPRPELTPGYVYDNIVQGKQYPVTKLGGKNYVWLNSSNYETTYTGVQPVNPLEGNPVSPMPVAPANRLVTYQHTLRYVELTPTEEKVHITKHYNVRGTSVDYWVKHAMPNYVGNYYEVPNDYVDVTEINGSVEDDSGGDRYNVILAIPDKDVVIAQLRARSVIVGTEYVEYVQPVGGEPGYYRLHKDGDDTYSDDLDNGLVFVRNGEEIDIKYIMHWAVGENEGYSWPGAMDRPAICYTGKYLMLEFFRNFEAIMVIDLSKPEFTCKVYRGTWGTGGATSTVRPVTANGISY